MVAILGILSAIVGINLPSGSDQRTLRDHASKLAQNLNQAADHALFAGQIIGIKLNESGFESLSASWQQPEDEAQPPELVWASDDELPSAVGLWDDRTLVTASADGTTLYNDIAPSEDEAIQPDLVVDLTGQWSTEPAFLLERGEFQVRLSLNKRGLVDFDD